MPTYKLTYFNVRARAELSRYVFLASGTAFEDYRLKDGEWPTVKPNTAFGSVPLLEVDGKQLAQSNAIARYVAREVGLMGANNWEAALCDQMVEYMNDLLVEMAKAHFADEAKKPEMQKKLAEETIPKYLKKLESMLIENGGTYFVGKKLSLADLAVTSFLDSPVQNMPDLLNSAPKLKAHRAMVLGLPKIKDYIKTRPETKM